MPNKKRSAYKKEYLAVVLMLIGVGVGLLWLSSAFNSSTPVTPPLVTYQVGDQIGTTGYFFEGLHATNDGSYFTMLAYFEPIAANEPAIPGLITHDISDNTPFQIGSIPYVIISYNVSPNYVVMQEVIPMPA